MRAYTALVALLLAAITGIAGCSSGVELGRRREYRNRLAHWGGRAGGFSDYPHFSATGS